MREPGFTASTFTEIDGSRSVTLLPVAPPARLASRFGETVPPLFSAK